MASSENEQLEDYKGFQTEGRSEAEIEDSTAMFSNGKARNSWQLFTSHGLVLISILNHQGRTVREIGLELNLTDRAVALAIADLVADGYLVRERIGRRTFYHVNEDHSLKYPVSPYGLENAPRLTVKALRAENLATHAPEETENKQRNKENLRPGKS
ncbi:MAG TPA: helix-turn-helix domain-containing protein [Chloroflexia bacterium]|nr:helix-turn-helix domain-containing protein [Chloroflexia bacterium]